MVETSAGKKTYIFISGYSRLLVGEGLGGFVRTYHQHCLLAKEYKKSFFGLVLYPLFSAAADDCIEPRPEYCAKNVHLCKVPGFIDFMKKMCPIHCGYC